MHAADPHLLPFPSHPAGWMAGEALQEGPPQGLDPGNVESLGANVNVLPSLCRGSKASVPILPHHPHNTHHCHKTSGSLVDAGILPRDGFFHPAISSVLRLGER